MRYIESKKGYYYKIYSSGKKVRISKKSAQKNMKGGVLSKQNTFNKIKEFDHCSINDIATIYEGINTELYNFIEVPQGHIYKYNGEVVEDIDSNSVIDEGNNIILSISGMGPCRGIFIQTEKYIYAGHLDSLDDSSKLRLETIEKALSDNDIISIYYLMGSFEFDCTLKETCSLCDISTYVIDIINKKNLNELTCIIEDFAYLTLTSKFGYDWNMDQYLVFPIHPEIKNRFITETNKYMENIQRCDNIFNKVIRKRKKSNKYKNSKNTCLSCGYDIIPFGKSKFKCSYKKNT